MISQLPKGKRQPIILAENCMKMKEFGPIREPASLAPLDPPLIGHESRQHGKCSMLEIIVSIQTRNYHLSQSSVQVSIPVADLQSKSLEVRPPVQFPYGF